MPHYSTLLLPSAHRFDIAFPGVVSLSRGSVMTLLESDEDSAPGTLKPVTRRHFVPLLYPVLETFSRQSPHSFDVVFLGTASLSRGSFVTVLGV